MKTKSKLSLTLIMIISLSSVSVSGLEWIFDVDQNESSLQTLEIDYVDDDNNSLFDEIQVNAIVIKQAEFDVTSPISFTVLMYTFNTPRLLMAYYHTEILPNGVSNISFGIPAEYLWSTGYLGHVHVLFEYFDQDDPFYWDVSNKGQVFMDLDFNYTHYEKPKSHIIHDSVSYDFVENPSTGLIEKLQANVTVSINETMYVRFSTFIRGQVPSVTVENAFNSESYSAYNYTTPYLEPGTHNITLDLVLYNFEHYQLVGTYFVDSKLEFNPYDLLRTNYYHALNLDQYVEIDYNGLSSYPFEFNQTPEVIYEDANENGLFDEILLVFAVSAMRDTAIRLQVSTYTGDRDLNFIRTTDVELTPEMTNVTRKISAEQIVRVKINTSIRLEIHVDWYAQIGNVQDTLSLRSSTKTISANFTQFEGSRIENTTTNQPPVNQTTSIEPTLVELPISTTYTGFGLLALIMTYRKKLVYN